MESLSGLEFCVSTICDEGAECECCCHAIWVCSLGWISVIRELFANLDSNADMPTVPPGEESLVFAKPHYEDQPFEELLEYVARQGTDPDFPPDAEVRYAQTRETPYLSA
jgi:hypothetical protein